MLALELGSELENLRSEFRSWIKNNKPPAVANDSEFSDQARSWQKKLADGKWLGLGWQKNFGGRGLNIAADVIIQEELARVQAPQIPGLFGISMVGPVLIKHGNSEQKERFLQKILDGSELWCQGFSEPNAGSDLAAITTRAEKVSGGFQISGQKIWTSLAHLADWCFVLARTSGSSREHQGLSYFLVDLKTAGISIRPLTQITGSKEFNEVFFDNVFVPEQNLVGAVGDGWKIAITTLMYERVVLTFARQLQSEVALQKLIQKADQMDLAKREKLANLIAKLCGVRALAYQHLLQYAKGAEPGPEGSYDKLFWSETFQELARFSWQLSATADAKNSEDFFRYLYSRGRTIAAGSSEIQRNIIAERLLKLPRLKYQS